MDPKRRSRTEQLHLYKPQQAKTIRQSFGYAFHLRNLTQHLRLGAFFSSNYTTADKRLALSAGIRMDGNTYNRKMRQLWKQFSPRLSASYKLSEQWTLSGSTGLYHQLPPYTALGYKDNEGQYLNKT